METGLKRKMPSHSSLPTKFYKAGKEDNTRKVRRERRQSVRYFKAKPMPHFPAPQGVKRSASAKVLNFNSLKVKGLDKKKKSFVDNQEVKNVFKARPAPSYKAPFMPKISNKKLTVPIEPVLHTDIRAHKRSEYHKD